VQSDPTVFVLMVHRLEGAHDSDLEPGFFSALTDGSLLESLAGLDLAAGEFP
jgi:hypothetical protein